jgi:WD40 repeat protein
MKTKHITLLFLLTAALAVGAPTALGADTPALLPKLEPIAAANASRLQPIAMLGIDVLHDAAWSPDGETLALVGTSGLWRYRVGQPAPERIEGYTGLFRSAAYSPDGKQFATGSDTGRLRLWDAASWQPTDVLQAAGESVEKLAYSPDRSLLAAGFADGTVRVWGVANRQIFRNWKVDGILTDLAFSPDGTQVAVSAQSNAAIFTVKSGEVLPLLDTSESNAVAFSPDGKWLAVSYERPTGNGCCYTIARLWDRAQRQWMFQLDIGGVIGFDQNSLLLTKYRQSTVGWDTEQLIAAPAQPDDYHANHLDNPDASIRRILSDGQIVRLNADSSRIAIITNAAVTITDYRRRTTLVAFQLPNIPSFADGMVNAIAFSPTDALMAFGDNNLIRLWDMQTGYDKAFFSGHELEVQQLAFSANGKWLASGSGAYPPEGGPVGEDGGVRVWNVESGSQTVLSGYQNPIENLQMNADGTMVYSDGTWDIGPLWQLSPKIGPVQLPEMEKVTHIVFSPANPSLAAVTFDHRGGESSDQLALWNAKTRTLTWLTPSPDIWGFPLFSADGRLLFTSDYKGWTLWDVAKQRPLKSAEGEIALGISPRGKTIAVGSMEDYSVSFMDTARFNVLSRTPETKFMNAQYPQQVAAFTPDGSLFRVANQLFDVRSGQLVTQISVPQVYYNVPDDYFTVAVSPDSRLIAVTKGGGVRLWGVLEQ